MKYFNSLLLFLAVLPLAAQDTRFFMPSEIREAYTAGTRAYDGRPGAKYWQNTADYTINVAVDSAPQRVTGEATVTYYNNSPDALRELVLRLYNNAYRKDAARRYPISADDVTEGVAITELSVDGRPIDLQARRGAPRTEGMLMHVPLRPALAAGAKVTLRVRWTTPLPTARIRAGVSDPTTAFVAYWYPQVAVYDDVFGWDELQYNLMTEFYHGLANFDVSITVPPNFLVWASGELQNADAVLPDAVLARYRAAHTSTTPTMIVTPDDLKNGYRSKSTTWRYRAAEVSDFAFAYSDHYAWEAAAQPVDGRSVFISSVYPAPRAAECAGLTALQQKTMQAFSEHMPGVPYPYPTFTTFIGTMGGGMEFPMMANNDGPNEGVTVHEMFHTYFPMYVRINEKRFAWMDEGWATYGTDLVVQRYLNNKSGPVFSGGQQGVTGTIGDLPLITSTQFMDPSNYGYASYPLPGFIYSMLHHHLGDELFYRCLREYIARWAKKSPTPYDFFYTFENVAGRKLDWLWRPWFFEFGYPDLAIKNLKGSKLTIVNRGTRPVPVHVTVKYAGGETRDVYADAGVWQKHTEHTVTLPQAGAVESIDLNADIPDKSLLDNLYPTVAERYKQHKVPETLAGAYVIQEFPATVYLEWEDGALRFRIPEAGQSAVLLPKSATALESPDGGISVEMLDNGTLRIKDFGYSLTAKKQ
jgi:hypothetical protein